MKNECPEVVENLGGFVGPVPCGNKLGIDIAKSDVYIRGKDNQWIKVLGLSPLSSALSEDGNRAIYIPSLQEVIDKADGDPIRFNHNDVHINTRLRVRGFIRPDLIVANSDEEAATKSVPVKGLYVDEDGFVKQRLK